MSLDRATLPDWEAYAKRVGLALAGNGRWRTTACAFHGGHDSMRINTESNGWICMSCGAKGGDVLAYEMQSTGAGFVDAARALGAWRDDKGPIQSPAKAPARPVAAPKHETLSQWGRDLWGRCSGLAGTVGEAYLRARGCRVPPADGDLRYCLDLWHGPSYTGPALVALLTDTLDGTPRSLHFTWVRADGKKAALDKPRRLLADHRKAGTVSRLWPDDAVSHGLGVGEGIETSLALANAHAPVWAAIDAGNLAAFPVLGGVEVLTIAADHDAAGIAAANTCAARWHAAARTVYVATPPRAGADMADVAEAAA